MDALEQKMKEKLLEGLIEHMQDKMGQGLEAKYPKKAVEVSVAAPDKDKLLEGLDHAKELTEHAPEMHPSDETSDEDRLMALMDQEDDDDEDDKKGY
jgi:hypothetical protein